MARAVRYRDASMNEPLSLYAPPVHDGPAPLEDYAVAAPRQVGPSPMSFGFKLIIASLVLFAVSLFLPVLEINFFKRMEFNGLVALIMVFPAAADKPLTVLPWLALGNVLMLLLPFIARFSRGKVLTIATLLSWVSTICAVVFGSLKESTGLLAGYYVWVASFSTAAIGATAVLLKRHRDSRLEVSF